MNSRYVGVFGLACGVAVGVAGVVLAARQRRGTQRARCLARQAETRARTDALTGLANRAGLHEAWPTLAPARPVLALIDLDGFKPVNDTYGHATGDAVLVTVAARLRDLLPGTHIARLGGDEFTAVLAGPIGRARVQALRIAASLALSIPISKDVSVTVTASIGLAPTTSGSLAETLAAADAAMYHAKAARTGVAVYDPRRDDRTSLAADCRPVVRVRDLATTSSVARLPYPSQGARAAGSPLAV